jgi:hypothetical protein
MLQDIPATVRRSVSGATRNNACRSHPVATKIPTGVTATPG